MGEQRYFEYDEQAIAYLKARDARLAEAIDAIGPVRREVTPDLFAALVNCIVGQQISTKAQVTVWKRLIDAFGDVTPEALAACPDDELQRFGLSFRKGVVLLDDSTFALTGVILQVLGLHVALLNVLLGAAGLVVKLVSKDLPRSSDKDDPGHST